MVGMALRFAIGSRLDRACGLQRMAGMAADGKGYGWHLYVREDSYALRHPHIHAWYGAVRFKDVREHLLVQLHPR